MSVAFLIGLLSTLHCIGMCGGLVGAMTMSLTPEIRNNTSRLSLYTFAYNMGRITSYGVAGLLVGLFGQVLKEILLPVGGVTILRLFASMLIIGMGFYLAGWFPQFSRVEIIGRPLWKVLQPVGQKLLPVKSIWQAFLFGSVWGWLPCGLVYYVLLISPVKDSAFDSALFMLSFGAGTLIPMMATGFLSSRLAPFFSSIRQSRKIRYLSGSFLILMGIVSAWLVLDPQIHQYLHLNVL